MTDYVASANRYINDVLKGKQPACEYVRLACERQKRDLKKPPNECRFDKQAANAVCAFIEALPHVKGRWAAKQEKLVLEPWQHFIWTTIFGWKQLSGVRRFREAYIEVPRKNGKSPVAAATGLYMFVADGEYGAEVYSGATSEKQAWEVFRPAKQMAERTPEFLDAFGVQVNAKTLNVLENGSRFEPVIGKPGDGASPSCAIIDEWHEHDGPELYDTMQTGIVGREQPLVLAITTAGDNRAGPCYQRRLDVISMLKGGMPNEQLFGIIYTLDEGDDWTDPKVLPKANPNFGVSVTAELLIAKQKEAQTSPARQQAFKTKHLNLWVGARAAWLNQLAWDRCPPLPPIEEFRGQRCYMAIDLSSKRDLTCVMRLFERDGEFYAYPRFYLPEEFVEANALTEQGAHLATWAGQGFITLTEGNSIDYATIEADIETDGTLFEIAKIAYDPWGATQLAQNLVAKGAPVIEYGQSTRLMHEPMKEIESWIDGKRLHHGDNPVLSWNAANVIEKKIQDKYSRPEKEKPENRIDGIVALIMAAGLYIADPKDDNESVYESRGLAIL